MSIDFSYAFSCTMPKHNEENATYLQKFTVAMFGDSGVGKTSVISRLVGTAFNVEHLPTVEDFHVKHLAYKNKTCELQIIDTSGTYEFPAMRRVDMEKADSVVLVYSMDRPESFTKIERYMDEIQEANNAAQSDKPVVVISNKSDLSHLSQPQFVDQRGLNISVGMYLAGKYGCHWFDCSAKLNENVEDIFHKILEYLFNNGNNKNKNGRARPPIRKISSLIQQKIKISR